MNSLEAIKMTAAISDALQNVRYTSDPVEKFGKALHATGYMVVKNPDFVPTPVVAVPELEEETLAQPPHLDAFAAEVLEPL